MMPSPHRIGLLLFLCATASHCSYAQRNHRNPFHPRLIIFVLDGANLSDWTNPTATTLRKLMQQGAVGLMNTRCHGQATAHNALATIGAGNYVEPMATDTSALTPLGDVLNRARVSVAAEGVSEHSDEVGLMFGSRTTAGTMSAAKVRLFASDSSWLQQKRPSSELAKRAGDINAFIEDVLKHTDLTQTTVMFISPMSRDVRNRLSPILLVGERFHGGVLTSASTRWNGIVTNLDIAPTILSLCNIPIEEARQKGMIGMPMHRSSPRFFGRKSSLDYITNLDRWTAMMHRAQPRLLTLFGIAEGLLIALAALFHKLGWNLRREVSRLSRYLLLIALWFPLAITATGGCAYRSPHSLMNATEMALLSFALSMVMALPFVCNRRGFATWFTAATFLLVLDLFVHFSYYSPLSFSLISGSRFFGMGNEYMGLLVACLLLRLGWDVSPTHPLTHSPFHLVTLRWLFIFLIIFLLGSSSFGAKFGGAVTAAAAWGTALTALSCERWTWKQTMLVVGFVLLLTSVTVLDIWRPHEAQSHIGRTFGFAWGHGADSLWPVALRKLNMNRSFITANPVSLGAILLMLASAVCVYRPFGALARLFASHPRLHRAMYGAPVGMFVGFAMNDSGIVVLVMMLIVYVSVIIGLLIEESCPNTAS